MDALVTVAVAVAVTEVMDHITVVVAVDLEVGIDEAVWVVITRDDRVVVIVTVVIPTPDLAVILIVGAVVVEVIVVHAVEIVRDIGM